MEGVPPSLVKNYSSRPPGKVSPVDSPLNFYSPQQRFSHWEVFLEINLIWTILKLYTSWLHWKNQPRSTVRKHDLLWCKHEYQHSADLFVENIFNPLPANQHSADIFVENIFNPLPANGLFLYLLKYIRKLGVSYIQETLKESSAIKWVKIHFIFSYLLCYLFK